MLIDTLLKHRLVRVAGAEATLTPSQQTVSIWVLHVPVLHYRLYYLTELKVDLKSLWCPGSPEETFPQT